jgi:methylated-DNA-[protein]-cysteine S-methyltransferase
MDTPICYTELPSPIGPLLAFGQGPLLVGLYTNIGKHGGIVQPGWRRADDAFDEVRRQLDAYFAGQLREFDLPLRMAGTSFQRRVWQELVRIPFGTTISYGELATRIGKPAAARAVGRANGSNPISIIVPCHRVIGADGTLTGYGGGLDNKRWLIDLERRAADGEAAGYSAASTVSRLPSMAARSGRS